MNKVEKTAEVGSIEAEISTSEMRMVIALVLANCGSSIKVARGIKKTIDASAVMGSKYRMPKFAMK